LSSIVEIDTMAIFRANVYNVVENHRDIILVRTFSI